MKSLMSDAVDFDALRASTPIANTTRLSLSAGDDTILLHEGPLHIDFGPGIEIPMCQVVWQWRREPMILVLYQPTDAQRMVGDAEQVLCKSHRIALPGLDATGHAVL